MEKVKINQKEIEKLVRKAFPDMKIKNIGNFSKGLTSGLVLKIKINNPSKTLVLKLTKLKRKNETEKNNKILNYLNQNNIPSPKLFYSEVYNKKIVTIMGYSEGNIASEIYTKGNGPLKRKVLKNAGKILNKIHHLGIPSFWVHQHHEIKNSKEWKNWTKLRIKKYLNFTKKNLPDFYESLEKELLVFWDILKKEKIRLAPLHWDYHLYNLNTNHKGDITGVFDFDNSMKGHNLADLGQTIYWIRFQLKDSENIKSFLNGYKKIFSKRELKMIEGYSLLHLLAVSRTIWSKQKRLGWIIDDHKRILNEILN